MSIVSGVTAAVMGSEATEDAANAARSAQVDATTRQMALQNRIINQQKGLTDTSDEALAYLKSAVLGGKQSITAPQYDKDGNYIGDKVYTGTFAPSQSPAAKWQLQQGTKTMNRNLAARGLLGSGNAATRLSDLENSINASEYDKQYGRLLDLVAKGSGASASTQSATNAMSNALQQGAQGIANAANQAGQAQASLYSGLGGLTSNALSTGLKAYDAGERAGYWGNNYQGSGVSYDTAQMSNNPPTSAMMDSGSSIS